MTGTWALKKATLLEVACFDTASAITAWEAGADRIELCNGKEEGGTTPTLACIEAVRKQVEVPIFVMIRPRGGDFAYSAVEFEQMRRDIAAVKPLVDGFVFGVLAPGNRIDIPRTMELVNMASPLPCTFHRAFDEAGDLKQALEDVAATGCSAILSSGGQPDATAGSTVLADLIVQAADRIDILPGGGVRAGNIGNLRNVTRAKMFHSSGIPTAASEVDPDEIRRMKARLG